MTLEFICNGYYAKSQEKATYTIELSVADDNVKYFNEILENGELNASHYNYTITIALRKLSWFRNIVFKEVVAIDEKRKFIYLVMLEWSIADDSGVDYYLYHEYTAAKDKYKRLIEDENNADISWVGSELFDENGDVNKGYHFECSEETDEEQNLCWKVADLGDISRFSIITLTKVEIL